MSTEMIGREIGRYKILELAGRGGMATVYKAHDTRLEREVAVKVIRREVFSPDEMDMLLKRFEREAKSLGRLSHPNIVPVIDYGEFEGAPYLVMIYLPGGTLKDRLGKPIPWQKAVRTLVPIAHALQYVHDQNIINRDIKPSNILLTENFEPLLTDFGLVKLFGDKGKDVTSLTVSGAGLGTPDYMAPEQWTGEATAQSDLYSLGVVLYEMITARRPYSADTPAGLLLKQASEPLPPPSKYIPDLPQDVELVLLKVLAKDPENRYPDIHVFVSELEKLLTGEKVTASTIKVERGEVHPIANRYIEIGDEYRDRGETQQAIQSYQQALNVNPGNLKAQTSMARVYLDQQNYDEAVTAFELALQIDAEDAVAQTGYCDATLALGDTASNRGENDQAIALYQKILAVNAAHAIACQRLAAIYQDRAERQLAAGQEDEALQSFKQALEFTPEDAGLSARHDEILAQKKVNMVTEWLGKAEKALTRQRWDEAAGMVQEALKVDPENEELAARLVEVKDAPRQFKLQGYRREAEGAIARGNWEKAIAALQTATQLAPEDQSLREQLEAVRNDQLKVQLDLHRKGAEKAIAAGDWEAAIAARQSALKLAPEDPDLVRALEETRQAQHQAQLDLFQKQLDEAVAAGNWEAAIQAVQAALKFAPQDAAWKNRLAEVEVARHQFQLDSLRAQAETARKVQKWDEAIAALENYRKLEPDDIKIQAEIEQLQTEKRESELKAFKTQAEKAAKAENWDEAVRAWESYLALGPDDGAQVEENIRHAQKYAKIAGDYAAAQEAIRKKRYGKAIELLQGVIAQEPTYKSTSRLLVEAVEANKAVPSWRRLWLLPAFGGVLLIVLCVVFGPRAWNAISTSIINRPAAATEAPMSPEATSTPEIKRTEPAEIAPEPTVTAGPVLPTPTAMPMPSWAMEFSEPILAAVAAHEPTFQDDFSSEVWGWYGPPFSIEDGVMRLGEAGGNPANLYIEGERNFVFQVEVSPPSPANPEVRVVFNSPKDWGYQFSLRPGGWTACNTRKTDDCTDSSWVWPEARKVQITVIMKATQAGFYLDGSAVAHLADPEFTLGGWNFGCDRSCEIDNVKVWDLDAIDLEP